MRGTFIGKALAWLLGRFAVLLDLPRPVSMLLLLAIVFLSAAGIWYIARELPTVVPCFNPASCHP